MSVLGQISSATAYVLKSCLSCIHTSFQVNIPTFQERTCSPAYYVLSKLSFTYFQEKAQATILTFLERTCTPTCGPSHNTYCRSCLSSFSINIIILTAQEFTPSHINVIIPQYSAEIVMWGSCRRYILRIKRYKPTYTSSAVQLSLVVWKVTVQV